MKAKATDRPVIMRGDGEGGAAMGQLFKALDEVGTVADDLQVSLQVGVVGAHGQLIVSLCTVCAGSGTSGAAGGAGGRSAAAAAGGKSRGCGQHTSDLQEIAAIDLTHRDILLLFVEPFSVLRKLNLALIS